jgi:hypothetical protein
MACSASALLTTTFCCRVPASFTLTMWACAPMRASSVSSLMASRQRGIHFTATMPPSCMDPRRTSPNPPAPSPKLDSTASMGMSLSSLFGRLGNTCAAAPALAAPTVAAAVAAAAVAATAVAAAAATAAPGRSEIASAEARRAEVSPEAVSAAPRELIFLELVGTAGVSSLVEATGVRIHASLSLYFGPLQSSRRRRMYTLAALSVTGGANEFQFPLLGTELFLQISQRKSRTAGTASGAVCAMTLSQSTFDDTPQSNAWPHSRCRMAIARLCWPLRWGVGPRDKRTM